MSLELLRELAAQALPVHVTDEEQIGILRRMRDEGDVIVLLPIGNEAVPQATVLLITAHGWRKLRGDPRPRS